MTTVLVNQFADAAEQWLSKRAPRRYTQEADSWGSGPDSVAVFHALSEAEERALLATAAAWQRAKYEAGYGAIEFPAEVGGAGLSKEHAHTFAEIEAGFDTPASSELVRVTLGLVAPTILQFGTPEQRIRYLPPLLRGEAWACQLFSEPEAGSDLASLRCRAERDGAGWRINGQKVWTSGAQFSKYGLLIARTDFEAKHAGLTAFMLPLDAPGVSIRPIRQMTGGASFNEVFLDDVYLPDEAARLGAVGQGWAVTMTTLSFEREVSGETHAQVGGSIDRLIQLAQQFGATSSPLVRNRLADLYIRTRVLDFHNERSATDGTIPALVAGSIGKLLWTRNLQQTSEIASSLLGPRLTADPGTWGTYCWTEHVLGAPGFRIAGGTDEIQRNILGERGLGLPREPAPATGPAKSGTEGA